jgi:hypothetical protein
MRTASAPEQDPVAARNAQYSVNEVCPTMTQDRLAENPKWQPKPFLRTARVEQEEFELACVREFSHSGLYLGVGVSRVERRERIRSAILREHKAQLRWQDARFTYADIFAQVYRQLLEASRPEDGGSGRPRVERRKFAMDDLTDDKETLEGEEEIFS